MKEQTKKTDQTGRKQVNILGINVDSTELVEVLTAVDEKISHNSKFYIVTPNPELVLASTYNPRLKNALNSADFAIPDGIGLAQAAGFLSLPVPKNIFIRTLVTFLQGMAVGMATFLNKAWLIESLNIVKGRELFVDLVKLAKGKRWRVFFLGGLRDEAQLAAQKLGAKFAKGPKLDKNAIAVSKADRKIEIDTIARINKLKPHLLFVAFGNPKQEIWMYKNRTKLDVGGMMGVGGTFRYIAGLSKLPPAWMESAGLEWVWRFVTEPGRAIRICNAWPIFPIKVWQSKLKS